MPINYSMDLDIDAYLRKRRTNVHNLSSHVASEQELMLLTTSSPLVLKDLVPQLSNVSDESEDSIPSVEQKQPNFTEVEEDSKPALEQNAAVGEEAAAPKEEQKERTVVLLSTQNSAEKPAAAPTSGPYSVFVMTQVQPEAPVSSSKEKEVAAVVSSEAEPESIEMELSVGGSALSTIDSIKEEAEPIDPVEVEKEEERAVQNTFSGGEESAFASIQLAIDNANKALAENSAPVLVTEEVPLSAVDNSPTEATKKEKADEPSVPDKFAVLGEDPQEEALGEKSPLVLTQEDVAALSPMHSNMVGFERELSPSSRSTVLLTFDPEPAKMLAIKVGSPDEPLLSFGSEMRKDSPNKVAHPVTNWQEINVDTPVMLKDDSPVSGEQTTSNCAVGEAEEDFFESAGCASMSEAMEPAREGVERVKLLFKDMADFFQKVDAETTDGAITDAIVPTTQEAHLLLKEGGSGIAEVIQPASQEAKMILTEAVEFLFPPFNNNSQSLPTTVEAAAPVAPVILKL